MNKSSHQCKNLGITHKLQKVEIELEKGMIGFQDLLNPKRQIKPLTQGIWIG